MATVEEITAIADRHGLRLRPDSVVPDDSGWDFAVFHGTANDGSRWILRVPRRPSSAALAVVEHRLLGVLRDRLTTAIPDWRIVSPQLIAYPRLAGTPAASEDLTTHDLHWYIDRLNPPKGYVDTLGRFMAELHAVPLTAVAATGVPVLSPEMVRQRFAARLEFGKSELGIHTEWLRRGQRWLDRDDLWSESMVLIHGDLHPGHTLVDDGGSLIGVIDWTDAEVGDPGQEFVEAVRKFEPPTLDALLDAYVRHGGPAWPGLRDHVIEAIAFAPLALAKLGFDVGKMRYVEAARELYARPVRR